MTELDLDAPCSRAAASAAVANIGWRYLLNTLAVSAPVRSLVQAGELAAAAVAACGEDADGHLRADLRPDRVELSVQTRALGAVTGRDTRLAHRVAEGVAGLGRAPPGPRRPSRRARRRCWSWPSTRWTSRRSGRSGRRSWATPTSPVPAATARRAASPIRLASFRPSGSSRWTPRGRSGTASTSTSPWPTTRPIRGSGAALAAGGRMVDDSFARSYWVLADAEGNEVCVCTWTGRDEPEP